MPSLRSAIYASSRVGPELRESAQQRPNRQRPPKALSRAGQGFRWQVHRAAAKERVWPRCSRHPAVHGKRKEKPQALPGASGRPLGKPFQTSGAIRTPAQRQRVPRRKPPSVAFCPATGRLDSVRMIFQESGSSIPPEGVELLSQSRAATKSRSSHRPAKRS